MSEANNADERVEQDPYYMWANLPYGMRLPREAVAAGLAKWLESQLGWVWDQQTEVKIPWYLERRAGLRAWCLDEATLRLSSAKRDSFSAAEFCEFHFGEALREHGGRALAEPFWDELIWHKRQIEDFNFFTHLHVLVAQPSYEFSQVKRLFCVLWDRAVCPLEYWSYNAMEIYLKETMARKGVRDAVPSANTLCQWVGRLGLCHSKYTVVTKYTGNGCIPLDGYCAEALVMAGIPVPLDSIDQI
jgi:hypothetical protein